MENQNQIPNPQVIPQQNVPPAPNFTQEGTPFEPQTPDPVKPKKNKNLLILVIILVFILLAGTVALVMQTQINKPPTVNNVNTVVTPSPSPSPKIEVISYQSPTPTPSYPPLSAIVENWKTYDAEKFTIDYPADWTASASEHFEGFSFEKDATHFEIFINQERGGSCDNLIKSGKMLVNGSEESYALWRKNCGGDNYSWIFTSFKKDDSNFGIRMSFTIADEVVGEDLFKQMVSTLKLK